MSMNAVVLESVLTCPHCGFAAVETMPTDACLHFYECSHCKTLLRPEPGDCCVFCSYGSRKCPPVQEHDPPRLAGVDVQRSQSAPRFDSGYTSDDIERILDDLIDAETQAKFGRSAGLVVSLALGLGGDVVVLSPTYTVMLEEPRSVIDARLEAICALISGGLSLVDALEALPASLQRLTDASAGDHADDHRVSKFLDASE